MNLLPKSHEEFAKADYWNTFFKKRGQKAFEWYGEFADLSTYMLKYIKPTDNILIVGCGNSKLGMDLYDAGYKNIKNIDLSPVVIKQMQEINKVKRPDLIFEQMDATQMIYESEKFNIVLDKGTLDALMIDSNDETLSLVNKYHAQTKRILKNGGRYICISLLQEHILRTLLDNFSLEYALRIIRCHDIELKAKEKDESPLPTFLVVSTKFIKLQQPILEMVLTDDPPIRLSNAEEILNNVISIQESASICNSLYKSSVASEGEISLDLYKPGEKKPRYTVYILDQLMLKEIKSYAAFIVPLGRELDWIFNSKEGRRELLKSAQHHRLAIVILRREQTFESLDSVKSELADTVINFAPSGLSRSQIPFLSLGSEIDERKICFEGKSEISGSFVVEEVENEDGLHRRLVFLNNQFVIQSEAKLKKVLTRRKKTKFIVDPQFLACNHHLYMTIGLKSVLKSKRDEEILIVGLGGGGLCTFIRQHIPEAKITAVEIDSAVLKVATDYFDLTLDEKLKVEIADGVEFLKNSADHNKKYTAILFDVDSKDISVGMSCPPKEFVDENFLKTVKECLLDDGLFILNLVARNKNLRDDVIEDLKKIFKFVATYKIINEVNEIIFCSKTVTDFSNWTKQIQESASLINNKAKSNSSSADELIEIKSLMNNIKLEI